MKHLKSVGVCLTVLWCLFATSQAIICNPINWPSRTSWNSPCTTQNVNNYTDSAAPAVIAACNQPLASGLLDTLDKVYPEGSSPEPSMIGPSIYLTFTTQSYVNVTYVTTGGSYVNRFGYFEYDWETGLVSNRNLIFNRLNNMWPETGCLKPGDTFRIGPFAEETTIGFYLDAQSRETDRFNSFIDPPRLINSDSTSCPPSGCLHTAWISLPDYNDVVIIGIEDQSLGDKDYNDVLFYFWVDGHANLTDIPEYGNDTIKKCNALTSVTTTSYAELFCTQWALLEATTPSACLAYMSIPPGYTWAPNDETSRAAVKALAAAKWSYTNADCFLLADMVTPPTQALPNPSVGFIVDTTGELVSCPSPSLTLVKTITSEGKVCYNTQCRSRIVLKGQELGTSCSTIGGQCSDSVNGQILANKTNAGSPVSPNTFSVYLRASPTLGTQALTSVVSLEKKLDIVVMIDVGSAGNSNDLKSAATKIFAEFKNNLDTNIDLAVGIALSVNSGGYYVAPAAMYTDQTSFTNAMKAILAGNGAPSSAATHTPEAITNMLNSGNVFWRPKAYRTVWALTAASDGWITSNDITDDLKNALLNANVVPFFQFAGGADKNLPSSIQSVANAIDWSTMFRSTSNTAWKNCFDSASSPSRGPAAFKTAMTTIYAVAFIDTPKFITSLPKKTTGALGAVVSVNFSVQWPNSGTSPNDFNYVSRILFLGRSYTDVSISFNHAPYVADVNGLSIPGSQTEQTISFTAGDPDSNSLIWRITTDPSKGKIYRLDGTTQITTSGTPQQAENAVGVMQVIYKPNPGESGSDSFSYVVDDGCLTDDGKATLTLLFSNRPPTATSFSIDIYEDALPDNDIGLIDFTGHYTDPDVGQALTLKLTGLPARGSLHTYPTATLPYNTDTRSTLPDNIRYIVANNGGPGTVALTYVAVDPYGLTSNTATVTINILPVPHRPILTLGTNELSSPVGGSNIPIVISVYDQDAGDSENVFVSAIGLTNQVISSLNGNLVLNAFISPAPITSATTTFVFSTSSSANVNWVLAEASGVEWIEFTAVDSTNLTSLPQRLTLKVDASQPPYWTERPMDSHPTPFDVMQGVPLENMRFSASDDDIIPVVPHWKKLKFTPVVLPSHGTIEISTGALPRYNITSASESFVNSDTGLVYVGLDDTLSRSFYYISYYPDPSYFGTDTFSFEVRDPEGVSAVELATVNVQIARAPTPPISSDCIIRTNEGQSTNFALSLASTNPGSNPVQLTMTSFNISGNVANSTGAFWTVGGVPQSNGGTLPSLPFTFTPATGVYSPEGVPTGNFRFTVYEPTVSLSGVREYVCTIYVDHVNHPPTSVNQAHTVNRRQVLMVKLPASDVDANDIDSTLTASFVNIKLGSKGKFFFDSTLETELTSDTLSTRTLTDRTFWYLSEDDFSIDNTPIATYQFVVTDQQGAQSTLVYSGTINVLPAGDPPVYGGELNMTTYQETALPMNLGTQVTTETMVGFSIELLNLPADGTLQSCSDVGICTPFTTPGLLQHPQPGRLIFTPGPFLWGTPFTSFDFSVTDDITHKSSNWTMTINVIHVNKRPSIVAANFDAFVTMNESTSTVLNWYADDVDSLPATLRTDIRVGLYAGTGWSVFTCSITAGEEYNTTSCVFDDQNPWGIRADFKGSNAKRTMPLFDVSTSFCPDFETLRTKLGQKSPDCRTHFKLRFTPAEGAASAIYVRLSFTAYDDYGDPSNTIDTYIGVKAINTPPTIWSPPIVNGGASFNPFIRDTLPSSATFNQPVIVADIDSNNGEEKLIIKVTEGSGELVWPADAVCAADLTVVPVKQWICLGRIPVLNSWLPEFRFNITSSNRKATLSFTIDDQGNSGDFVPSPHLTATSFTTLSFTPALAPKSGSNTLAIAVGVAAGAGLLLLGALGFFLRNKVGAPTDDYFAAATTPLSAAPQSPLYAPQFKENFSPLYKGN